MRRKGVGWDPKVYGLPAEEPDEVPPLPAPPEQVKEIVEETKEAWRAYDATLVVSDGDVVLADKMFDAARKRKKGKP